MQITTRTLLLLILAAPLVALTHWLPFFGWVAAGYVLLCLLLMVADWLAAGPVSELEAGRQHDNRLSLGADNPIVLHVRQRRPRPLTFWIRDEPPDAFQLTNSPLAEDAPENRPDAPPVERILQGQLPPRGAWQQTYYVRPLRRGDYTFGDINLRWLGPLGLVIRQGVVPAAGPVKVYPNLLDVRRYDLLLRRNRLQELGLRHARHLGQGTEFERLREYTPDDEYRRINWKATARRHRPVTTDFQTERSQTILAMMDTGRMMQSPVAGIAKLDYVLNAVLLLAYVAGGMGDKMGMMTFADDVHAFLAPRQGRGQFYRMLEMLYAVDAQPVEPDYARALSYLALRQRKRSLVVLFTDLSGGASMQSLANVAGRIASHNLLLVVTISDPDIHAVAQHRPEDTLQVHQQVSAARLLEERRVTLDYLERQGVLTLDVPANALSVSVIRRYLQLKTRELL